MPALESVIEERLGFPWIDLFVLDPFVHDLEPPAVFRDAQRVTQRLLATGVVDDGLDARLSGRRGPLPKPFPSSSHFLDGLREIHRRRPEERQDFEQVRLARA